MSCPNLLPGWERGSCTIREFSVRAPLLPVYRYMATGHVQLNLPGVGDEFLSLHLSYLPKCEGVWETWEIWMEELETWWQGVAWEGDVTPVTEEWTSVREWSTTEIFGLGARSSTGESINVPRWDLKGKWTSKGEWTPIEEWAIEFRRPDPPYALLPEKPRIAWYQTHESVNHALSGRNLADPMNRILQAVKIEHFSNIFSLGILLFVFGLVFSRSMNWINDLEGHPKTRRDKSLRKDLRYSRPLVSLRVNRRHILAFGLCALIALGIAGPSLQVVYEVLLLSNLIPAILCVVKGPPSRNLGALFMRFRLDKMVSRKWYEFLAPLNFWCLGFLLFLSITSLQNELKFGGQTYSPYRHRILYISIMLGWIFRPNIIDRLIWTMEKRVMQLKSVVEISPGIGRVRMDWECHCGAQYSDYFFEFEPGAVQRLADQMHSSGSIRKAAVTTEPLTIFSVLFRSLSNLFVSLSHLWRKEISEALPKVKPSAQPRNDITQSDYLLLCIKESKYTTAMSSLRISDIKSDLELFEAIRGIFMSQRLKILQFLSLTTVKRIDFVKFLLCESSLVDCIKRNQLPPKKVEFYAFDPRQPRVIPPIGTEFLLHHFHRPKCGDGKDRCLKQFPKRLNRRPQHGQPPDYDVVWGLHIVEGPYFATVITWHIAVAAFGSFLFGVLYWYFERDISGAFTVSGYMTSLTSLAIGAWQVWIFFG